MKNHLLEVRFWINKVRVIVLVRLVFGPAHSSTEPAVFCRLSLIDRDAGANANIEAPVERVVQPMSVLHVTGTGSFLSMCRVTVPPLPDAATRIRKLRTQLVTRGADISVRQHRFA